MNSGQARPTPSGAWESSMAWPRRVLHMKGDVVCTLLLLLLACLLLFIQQILLSSRWDTTTWRLEVQASTSSSRALLTHSGARMDLVFPEVPSGHGTPQLPACKTQESPSKTGISQSGPKPNNGKPNLRSKGKTTSKGKGRRKTAAPTKAAGSPLSTLPPFDFAGYLREKDNRYYQLIINQPEKCTVEGEEGSSSSAPYMLVAVKSVAADFDKRQVVRRTWGTEGLFQNGVLIRRVFLLGVPRNGSALPLWNRLLAYESETFKDILLWDFEDTFFNLTLKETHFLLWVNTSCPAVRFIFKGDADVYVNMENILEMLWGRSAEEDLFVGDIILHARPIRRRSSKYYVPEFIYGGALYPTYAGGGGFVMSGHTARRLSAACEQVELFPIDDVFLGMCLQLIGVKPSRHDGFRTFGIPRPLAAPHLQTFDPCFYRDLMVVHSLTVPQIWLMWNLLHDPKLSCHTGRRPTPWPFRWREGAQTTVETDYDAKSVFVKH